MILALLAGASAVMIETNAMAQTAAGTVQNYASSVNTVSTSTTSTSTNSTTSSGGSLLTGTPNSNMTDYEDDGNEIDSEDSSNSTTFDD